MGCQYKALSELTDRLTKYTGELRAGKSSKERRTRKTKRLQKHRQTDKQ